MTQYVLEELFEKSISGEWGNELEEGQQGVKVIRTTNFTNKGKIDLQDVVEREIDVVRYACKILKQGDIIIEKSGGSPKQPVGRTVLFEETEDVYFCNNFTSVLRPLQGFHSKYLLYILMNLYNQRKVLKFQNKTTGIINLKLHDYLRATKVNIPSLKVQQKIANVLDKAQSLIDKRKEQIEACNELIKSLFYIMFGDPVTNPKGWDIGIIRDLTSEVKYGTSKKADEHKGSYPVIRMNNITYQGNWNLSDLKYVDLEENELEKYLVYKGDMLFNRTNSKELVGKTAVYNEDIPMAYAGYLVRLRTNEKANSQYIATFLNSPYGKATLQAICKSIVGMANINAQELQEIKIPITPIELQNKFANQVEKIEQQKQLLEQSLTELENNFNSLMQRAFKGELF